MTRLEAREVAVTLGTREVLRGASLTLVPGQVILLAGRNGAGKSTLLRACAGLRRTLAGGVLLDGVPLRDLPPRQRARSVSYVPQDEDSPFEFTGRELVRMGRHPHVARFASLLPADHAAVQEALARVDALAFADRSVHGLSGGERRRIAIARALATQAPLLLADEPTTNLDLEHALQIVALLRTLAVEGHGVLVASHDLDRFAPHVDLVALLHEGRVVECAPPAVALRDENLERVFGVRRGPGGQLVLRG